jgi:hypothetical protein
MVCLVVDLKLEQVRAIVRDLDRTLDPVGFARLPGSSGVNEALWLYTLFHRVVMWCGLTRRGDTSDGPSGLLRDLYEMSR